MSCGGWRDYPPHALTAAPPQARPPIQEPIRGPDVLGSASAAGATGVAGAAKLRVHNVRALESPRNHVSHQTNPPMAPLPPRTQPAAIRQMVSHRLRRSAGRIRLPDSISRSSGSASPPRASTRSSRRTCPTRRPSRPSRRPTRRSRSTTAQASTCCTNPSILAPSAATAPICRPTRSRDWSRMPPSRWKTATFTPTSA